MLTAEAHVHTERPSRYLVQLCQHASQMRQHLGDRPRPHHGEGTPAPPEVQHVEWSDTHGIVRLNWGQWTLQATEAILTLRVEAATENDLQQIQGLLAGRLEKIGRRDHLTVNWQRPDAPTVQPGDTDHVDAPLLTEPPHRSENTRRWVWARGRPLIAAVALLVGVHLGLGGAALATSQWTAWTTIGLVALFVAKVLGLRLLATRRGPAPDTPGNALARMFRNHVGYKNRSRRSASAKASDNSAPP